MNRAPLVMSRQPRVSLGCMSMVFGCVIGFTRPARADDAASLLDTMEATASSDPVARADDADRAANVGDASPARSTSAEETTARTSRDGSMSATETTARSPSDGTVSATETTARSPGAAETSARTPGDGPVSARREVVFALGYGFLVSPRHFLVYGAKDIGAPTSTLGGITVDVTRRSSSFEYGAHFFTTGGTTDGAGAPAHVITMAAGELRFFPWSFASLDPWLGTTLGVALADDYNAWNKTDTERAHTVTADVRAALTGRVEAGARLRASRYLALSARGGIGWLGFSRGPGIVREADGPKYTVRPTDYGRHAWFSLGLALELTVAD